MTGELGTTLLAALARHEDRAIALRRLLHRSPDLSGHEGPTRDRVVGALPPGILTPVADTGAEKVIASARGGGH